MFDPKEQISERIEEACREYADPESDMTVIELEERIERAFRMEYTYEEVIDIIGTQKFQAYPIDTSPAERELRLMGMQIEPGETIRLDETFGTPEPFGIDIDPWDEEEETTLGDIIDRDPEPGEIMMVRGDVEIQSIGDGAVEDQLLDGGERM